MRPWGAPGDSRSPAEGRGDKGERPPRSKRLRRGARFGEVGKGEWRRGESGEREPGTVKEMSRDLR